MKCQPVSSATMEALWGHLLGWKHLNGLNNDETAFWLERTGDSCGLAAIKNDKIRAKLPYGPRSNMFYVHRFVNIVEYNAIKWKAAFASSLKTEVFWIAQRDRLYSICLQNYETDCLELTGGSCEYSSLIGRIRVKFSHEPFQRCLCPQVG